jgi:YggT family protein
VNILDALLTVYLIIVVIRIILSWIPISYGSPLEGFASLIYGLTEPVMGPLRRVLPPVRLGGMALDLSPIIVIFGIQVLRALVR